MNVVKGEARAPSEPHVAILLDHALSAVRTMLMAEEWQGLRQSHFRLLSYVPPAGISITELAADVGMTKQGCGQFVSFLTDAGHLVVAADRPDGRLRVVRRTAAGDEVVRVVDERIERLERQWADQVGARRYATFRRVLSELHAAERVAGGTGPTDFSPVR